MKWNTAYQIDNVLCVNLVKVSILLFVLRMQNNKMVAYLIWTVMFIMSAVNLVTLAIFASQCRPLAKLWNITLPGVCSDHSRILQIGYAQGVVNVLTDLFCTMTPIFVLWKVQISTRLKVVICGLMSLGLIATASQIVRVITLRTLEAKDYSCMWPELVSAGIITKLTYRIQTDEITAIFISAILDQNLGIIAACIPTYQPLFRSLAATIRSVGQKRHSSRESSYRILPDNIRRSDHRQEEAFNLQTLTSRPVPASEPREEQNSQKNDSLSHD